MNMIVGNTLFKNRTSHLVKKIYLKDIKFFPEHEPLVCDFKIRKVKETRRKIWELHEDTVKSDFKLYISEYRPSSQKDASVEGYWNVSKGALLMLYT